jgi:hypothetical protein
MGNKSMLSMIVHKKEVIVLHTDIPLAWKELGVRMQITGSSPVNDSVNP